MKIALISACLGIIALPAYAASPRLAVAQTEAKGEACVVTSGAPLQAGARFWIVLFDPPRIVDGEIVRRAQDGCGIGKNVEGDAYSARLRFSFDSTEWGVAVFAPGSHAEYFDGEFILRTPEAKTPLSFRSCASHEGLHLTTWRGSRRTWHQYVYLGYELKSDCTDSEVE